MFRPFDSKKGSGASTLALSHGTTSAAIRHDTIGFAALWFEEKARKYATKKPEITIGLGLEQLAQMKAQVCELARNADRIVRDALEDPEFWWRLTPHMNAPAAAYEQLGNDKVGNKFPEGA